jgi:hypothetical protein
MKECALIVSEEQSARGFVLERASLPIGFRVVGAAEVPRARILDEWTIFVDFMDC